MKSGIIEDSSKFYASLHIMPYWSDSGAKNGKLSELGEYLRQIQTSNSAI